MVFFIMLSNISSPGKKKPEHVLPTQAIQWVFGPVDEGIVMLEDWETTLIKIEMLRQSKNATISPL